MHCVTVCVMILLIAQIFELLKSCIILRKRLSIVGKKNILSIPGVYLEKDSVLQRLARDMLGLQYCHVMSSLS